MQYSVSNPLVRNYIFPRFIMVITVLWAELWFVVGRCNLAKSVGIVHILIRIILGYFRYIKPEREDILVAFTAYSTVVYVLDWHDSPSVASTSLIIKCREILKNVVKRGHHD